VIGAVSPAEIELLGLRGSGATKSVILGAIILGTASLFVPLDDRA